MRTAEIERTTILLLAIIVLFTVAVRLIDWELAEELQARTSAFARGPRVEPAAWAALRKELAHGDWAHAAFAHLRFSDEPTGASLTAYTTTRRVLDYSIVQDGLWWTILVSPMLLVAWEASTGARSVAPGDKPQDERWRGRFVAVTAGVFALLWTWAVHDGWWSIEHAATKLSVLAASPPVD